MSTKCWLGQADATTHVITFTISSPTPGEVFTLTCGGIDVVTYTVDTPDDAEDVASWLASEWNSSTNAYCTNVTATSSGAVVTLTADVAGWPFEVTGAVDVSSAADIAKATTTTATGPNHWDNGDNWLDCDAGTVGTAPVNGDDVAIVRGSVNICWGLDQSAVALSSLRVDLDYTGRIGLRRDQFATSANGATYAGAVGREYREDYLKIGSTRVDLGKRQDIGTPNGSQRIKIDNVTTGAVTCVIHETGKASADTNLPATRLLFNSSSASIMVMAARAGVGITCDCPGETSTVDSIEVTTQRSTDRVMTGPNTTLSTWRQNNGDCSLEAVVHVPNTTVTGGTLTTKGDMTMGTLNANGGTVNLNHYNSSSGNDVDTINLNGATVDLTQSAEPTTIGTLNPDRGTLRLDSNIVTISTWNEPTGQRSVSFTE